MKESAKKKRISELQDEITEL